MYDDKDLETIKIVLIGESGVGKTSIILQFVDQKFKEEQQSTMGGMFSTKTIKFGNGQKINIELWDTAGQERYRSISNMFYKDAQAVLLVYDITSRDSFEELKNYWMTQVKDCCMEKCIIGVVANKSDLFEQEEVDENEAREFARNNNALFAITSAKNTSGIDNLFLEISKKYTSSETLTLGGDNSRNDSVKLTMNSFAIAKKKKCC